MPEGLGTFPISLPSSDEDAQGDTTLPVQDLLMDVGDDDVVYLFGDLATVHGTEGIAQACRIALRLQKGEWFLRPDDGIDWFGKYLGIPNPNLSELRADCTRQLFSVSGVTEVISIRLDIDRSTRRLAISFEVMTDLDAVASGALAVP